MGEGEIQGLCGEAELARLAEAIGADAAGAAGRLDRAIGDYPGDPRLHFLKGSILAADRRYDEAREALARAVAIAPDYAVARFQLGLLELSSGNAEMALATLRPLLALAPDHYLRLFAEGIELLIGDRFGEAVERLSAGIAANGENPPMNADMALIVEEARAKLRAGDVEPTSPAHQLLSQSKTSRH